MNLLTKKGTRIRDRRNDADQLAQVMRRFSEGVTEAARSLGAAMHQAGRTLSQEPPAEPRPDRERRA